MYNSHRLLLILFLIIGEYNVPIHAKNNERKWDLKQKHCFLQQENRRLLICWKESQVMGRRSEEIVCKVLTIWEALWLVSLVAILLLIPPFSEPQFPSVDKRLRVPVLSQPPYLWMLPFSKIHATNKKTLAATQSRITLISETRSHVFEPPASWVVIWQKEAH